ncbi:MAG: transglutaminase domain-containing protein [Alphaproteobacteria bacterium]|nr:transglutaminase domain-containing protein [Alphaproteobacteria bacterium]
MIKRFLFLCVLFFSCGVFAVSMGERRALSIPKGQDDNMPRLVHHLTDNIPDKTEQAKAIAVWIASHIAYDHDLNSTYRIASSKAGQSGDDVFKNRIGICSGFSDLYEKMLRQVGIRSEKVYGYVVENAPTQTKAKLMVKKEKIGHVWTKVHIPGRLPLLVDTTWMARGSFGGTKKRHSEMARKREIRQNKRENKSYAHNMKYFDFDYADLMNQGEYRFSTMRQLIKK